MMCGQLNAVSCLGFEVVKLCLSIDFLMQKSNNLAELALSISSQRLHFVPDFQMTHRDARTRLHRHLRNGGETQAARLYTDWTRRQFWKVVNY